MITVCLSNQKGGCGKSTTAWALATGLVKRGIRVLLIDLDAQRNLSFTAGVDLLGDYVDLYDVFKNQCKISDAIHEIKKNLHIVVGGLELAQADMEFTQQGREFMLKEALELVQHEYDFCVIDTEPHLGLLVANALTASDMVIIPIQADAYGLQGLQQLQGFIERTKKYSNKDLIIDGLLITKFDPRTNLSQMLLPELEANAKELGTKVYESKIRCTVSVQEAALLKKNLFEVAPTATATLDYQYFINEFINDIKGVKNENRRRAKKD